MACKTTRAISEEQFVAVLNELEQERDYTMLAIVGLLAKCTRIADVLTTITIKDVFKLDGTLRDELRFTEAKTGKARILLIKGRLLRMSLEKVYESTLSKKDRSCNLFYSRKGKYSNTPIATFSVNRKLKKFVGKFDIEELSSHAIRKTGARLLYEAGVSMTIISETLNHNSPKISYRYLSIVPNDVRDALAVLEF